MVELQILVANGRRRFRTLTESDVTEAAKECRKCKEGFRIVDGGRMPLSSRHRPMTTLAILRNHRGMIWGRVFPVRADQGTGYDEFVLRRKWVGPDTAARLEQVGFVRITQMENEANV